MSLPLREHKFEAPEVLGFTSSIQLMGSLPWKPSRVLVWVCHNNPSKSGSSRSLLNFLWDRKYKNCCVSQYSILRAMW